MVCTMMITVLYDIHRKNAEKEKKSMLNFDLCPCARHCFKPPLGLVHLGLTATQRNRDTCL